MASGSFENAQLLLNWGADANGRDNSGRTALWYAAISDNTGFITLLLEHGADVNARDEAGRTALMNAADLCYTWDVRALLDGGADPSILDKRGRTALEPQLVSVGDRKMRHGTPNDRGRGAFECCSTAALTTSGVPGGSRLRPGSTEHSGNEVARGEAGIWCRYSV